jgi:hypothetical protein
VAVGEQGLKGRWLERLSRTTLRGKSLYLVQGRHFSKADDTLEKKPTGQGSQMVSEVPVAGNGWEGTLTIKWTMCPALQGASGQAGQEDFLPGAPAPEGCRPVGLLPPHTLGLS